MKTKGYLAKHESIGLDLSIVLRPFKFIFLKASEQITYENLSVLRTFAFKSAGFLQSIEFGVQHTLKVLCFCRAVHFLHANTYEKSNFRMPNFIISKDATPMNTYLERTMFTSISATDFAMQNPFKVRSTQEERLWYQFFAHFTLKE